MSNSIETRPRSISVLTARLLHLGSAVLLALSFVFYLRGLDREADAVFAAGGDAGLYGVGAVFTGALMLPALAVLAAAAVRARSTTGAVLAFVSGLLDLALAGWLASMMYPAPRRTDEGLRLPLRMVEEADQAYLIWLVLLAVAGVLAVLAGLASLRARPDAT